MRLIRFLLSTLLIFSRSGFGETTLSKSSHSKIFAEVSINVSALSLEAVNFTSLSERASIVKIEIAVLLGLTLFSMLQHSQFTNHDNSTTLLTASGFAMARKLTSHQTRFKNAESLFVSAEKHFQKYQWFKAIQFYHQAISQLRTIAKLHKSDSSEKARRLLILASEQEHRAWVEISQKQNFTMFFKSLKEMAHHKGLPTNSIRYQERVLSPDNMINIQGDKPVGRLTVDYRKLELNEGLNIRIIAIQSEDTHDESRGKIFILDGHHRARAAFELGAMINTFLITVPSEIACEYAKQALFQTNRWVSVSEMGFDTEQHIEISLGEATKELKTNLHLYDQGKRSSFPLMVNFERRGRFMTWEDIRDYITYMEDESSRRKPSVKAYRLSDGRIRLVNSGNGSSRYLEQRFFTKLTQPMREAILHDVLRITDSQRKDGDIKILVGPSERLASDAYTISVKGTDLHYRAKPTHSRLSEIEIERSHIAALLHLGPRIIYAHSLLNPDLTQTGMMIREFYRHGSNLAVRGPKLSDLQQRHIGEQLAIKIYTMFDPKRTHRVIHRFDELGENLFIIGKRNKLKIRFVDWRPDDEDLHENKETAILKRFQKLIPAILTHTGPTVLAFLLLHLRFLSQSDSPQEAQLYEDAYNKAMISLNKGKDSLFFHEVENIKNKTSVDFKPRQRLLWRYSFSFIPLLFIFLLSSLRNIGIFTPANPQQHIYSAA